MGRQKEENTITALIDDICNAFMVEEMDVKALIRLGDAPVEPILERWNGELPEGHRDRLAYILGRIGGENRTGSDKALDALIYLLDRSDDDSKIFIVNALSSIRTKEKASLILKTLMPQLQSEDPMVRARVVDAMGDIGGQKAAGLLIQALFDDDFRVSSAAFRALENIGIERLDAGIVVDRIAAERAKVEREAENMAQKIRASKSLERSVRALLCDRTKRPVDTSGLEDLDIESNVLADAIYNYENGARRLIELIRNDYRTDNVKRSKQRRDKPVDSCA